MTTRTQGQNESVEVMEVSEEGAEREDRDACSSASDELCENTLNDYETQLLGFTPVTFINGVFNAVCDLYREALKAFCATCEEKFPGVITKEELSKARHGLSQEIDKDINEVFDKLEIFALRNVFPIPNECVLPEDMCQLNFNSSQSEQAKDDIEDLKRKIVTVKYANACLVTQLEKAKAFKNILNQVLDSLATHKIGGNQDVNLKDVLSYLSDMVMENFAKVKT